MEHGSQSSGTLTTLHATTKLTTTILEQVTQIRHELARADDGGYIRLTPFFIACLRLFQATSGGSRSALSTNLGFEFWELDTLMNYVKLCRHIFYVLKPVQPRQLNISLVAKRIPRSRTSVRFAYSNPALPQLAELDHCLASMEQDLTLILSSKDSFSAALTWCTSTSTWMIPGVGYETGDVLEVPFRHPRTPILHEGRPSKEELAVSLSSRGAFTETWEIDEGAGSKVGSLEEQSRTLHDENERLRRELTRFATENEILRALQSPSTPEQSTIPKPTAELAAIYPRDIEEDDASEALLTAAATWDYIQGHDLFRRGLLDNENVVERLWSCAKTDEGGLLFREGDVNRAIHESKRGQADTLDLMDLDSLSARTGEARSTRSTVTVHQKREMLGQMLTGMGAVQKDTSATTSLMSITSPEADSPWSERDGLPPPYALSPGVFYHTSIEAMMYSSRHN